MAASEFTPKIRLFYSYAHKDDEFRKELEEHLALLKRQALIETWHDRNINVGADWKEKIHENLESADIVLLLISAAFIASDYCHEIEMKRAMEKHRAGETLVIPIILRSCDWQSSSFSKLQALPIDVTPIAAWSDKDAAWTNVALGIRNAIERLKSERERENSILERIKPAYFSAQYSAPSNEKILSVNDMIKGAKTLRRMVVMNGVMPDIIVGLNGGGLIVAAAMNAIFMRPLGVIDFRNAMVTYVSLPHVAGDNEKVKPPHRQILVVDTKLKSGDALESSKNIIQAEYGKEGVNIRYGIVLGYGGWNRSRWKPDLISRSWPIQFRAKSADVYLACYTETLPDEDDIIEELRPGWENL